MVDLNKIKSDNYFYVEMRYRILKLFSKIKEFIPKVGYRQKIVFIVILCSLIIANITSVSSISFGKQLTNRNDFSIMEHSQSVEDIFDSGVAIAKITELKRIEEIAKQEEEAKNQQANKYYNEIKDAEITGGSFRLSLYNHDAQTIINNINNWFAGYPLEGLGETFLKVGSAYDVDPYVLAAMATQESGRGVHQANSYNVFGLTNGGLSNGFKAFSSYEESISFAAKTLAGPIYLGSGMTSLSQIGPVYCPSPGGWADKIMSHIYNIAG